MDLDLKQKVLAEVEERVSPDTVIASNTGFLPVSRIAAHARHKERVVGMHYFYPVHKMPLVELIAPEGIADWALHTAHGFAHRQGKTVIQVKDRPGFYTTRILCRYLHEALVLLGEGNDIEKIDEAMKDFGYSSGPMALMDQMGLEVVNRMIRFMSEAFGERWPEPLIDLGLLVDAGFLGRKNGRGFYAYPVGKKGGKKPNREIYSSLPEMKKGITDHQKIHERLALIMVNEAATCLEEEVIASPRDGDVGAVLGLGFPPFLGGPFHYADNLGVGKLVKDMEDLTLLGCAHFEPAGILKDMAKKGKRFFE
jgi:3-hydroxyacyl-CoA dehydrogenase/enoyl-CoA hydratase/3-hydroxybutyryl-CoA epimerase